MTKLVREGWSWVVLQSHPRHFCFFVNWIGVFYALIGNHGVLWLGSRRACAETLEGPIQPWNLVLKLIHKPYSTNNTAFVVSFNQTSLVSPNYSVTISLLAFLSISCYVSPVLKLSANPMKRWWTARPFGSRRQVETRQPVYRLILLFVSASQCVVPCSLSSFHSFPPRPSRRVALCTVPHEGPHWVTKQNQICSAWRSRPSERPCLSFSHGL